MNSIINNFKKLSKQKRCSGDAEGAFLFLKKYAKDHGYEIKEDAAKNIYAYRGTPKVCLQAHYDMVCLGEYDNIEVIQKDGMLSAKNSTLGADNGIGVAYMMELMQKKRELGFLFTADEEIGLLGAKNLAIEISGDYLINLDFETGGEVCIGCAGGFDIGAKLAIEYVLDKSVRAYRVVSEGFSGGHSGIDIGTKSAIKEFAKLALAHPINLVEIDGGEKINSIPKHLNALISTQGSLPSTKYFGVGREDRETKQIRESARIIRFLNVMYDGILDYDKRLSSVLTSFNISRIYTQGHYFFFEGMGRSSSLDELVNLQKRVEIVLEEFGFFDISIRSSFPPWEAKEGKLQKELLKIMQKQFKEPKMSLIHAGLEPAIFQHRFKECVSIGPTITHPHTTDEKADVESIMKTYEALEELIERVGR